MKLKTAVCPNCKHHIGDIYVIEGKSHLFNNGWLIRDGKFNCPVCTKRFYWHAADFDRQHQHNANEFMVE